MPRRSSSSSTRSTKSLSACQIGITIASIGIGFLGEPSLAILIEPVFGGLSHGVAAGLSLAIAFVIVTALHISVGEQVPKMLAIAHAEAHGEPDLPPAQLVPRSRPTPVTKAPELRSPTRSCASSASTPATSKSTTPPRT